MVTRIDGHVEAMCDGGVERGLAHSLNIHWQRPPPRGDREAACGGSVSHLFKPQCTSQGPLLKVTWPGLAYSGLCSGWRGVAPRSAPSSWPLPSLLLPLPRLSRALPALRAQWESGRLLAAGSWHNLGMDLLTLCSQRADCAYSPRATKPSGSALVPAWALHSQAAWPALLAPPSHTPSPGFNFLSAGGSEKLDLPLALMGIPPAT